MEQLSTHLQHLLYVVYITPSFLAMTAFVTLLFKKRKDKSHKALLFVFLAAAIVNLMFVRHFFFLYPNVTTVLHYPNLLVGTLCAPTVIIYFMSLLRPSVINRRKVMTYLAASIFYVLITLVLLLTDLYPKTYFTREAFASEIFTFGNIVRLTLLTTYLSHVTCYTVIIVKTLKKYRQKLKHKYSYTQGVRLDWANWALLATSVFALLPLSMILFETVQIWMLVLHGVVATATICILFFAGYYQPVLDEDREERDLSLPLDNRKRLKNDILDLFELQKRFRDMNLSVDDIAQDLKTNRTYVSRVINEEFGMNFYGFVNKYRMAEFMQLLQQSDNPVGFKIKEVSEQVGFKSYTSFYNFFKEQTGYTPSEYVKRM